jgi:iron complex transport system substrate-binding protein
MKNRSVVLSLMLVLLLAVMPAAQAAPVANITDGCVEVFDETVDYFPEKVEVDYATGFAVEYFNHYKVVLVLPWPGAEEPLEFVLVQCGTPAPDGYDAEQVVSIPVNRFVGMSTSILPHLEAQGVLDRLVGMDTTLFVHNESILERAQAGEIVEIGGGGSGTDINTELVLELEPDVVMAQEFFAGGTTFSSLREAGVTTVLNADYADTTPLGQAEWGKFVALFFNTEALAAEIFDGVAERYQELQALTAEVESRPTVITASPYNEIWFMPGGDSTVAMLLADAGADFLWADETGTSFPLDFEVVFDRGIDADYWVNINQFWNTTADMLADDARFAEFAAYQNGNLWNNNARMNPNGGNDYFESGFANPDVILADLIAIFHPDLLPDHELVYYQRLALAE